MSPIQVHSRAGLDHKEAEMRARRLHGGMGPVIWLCLAPVAHTAEPTDLTPVREEPVSIELFTGPILLKRGRSVYPESDLHQGRPEGWVYMHLMVDPQAIVDAQINTGTSWFYMLFKKRFQIAVTNGELAEIKLRCDKQYVFFRYEPDIQYRVSDRHGNCGVELVGAPGTKFSLVQS